MEHVESNIVSSVTEGCSFLVTDCNGSVMEGSMSIPNTFFKRFHDEGTCDITCSYCYEEACSVSNAE